MNIIEIMRRWPDQEAAIAHLERVRWAGESICPYCGSVKTCVHASKDKTSPRWQCQDCRNAFSVTVGTIFHHTHLPLQTWFLALAIMLNAKKNVSNAQLARDLGLPYKTAYSLAQRIRKAMATDPGQARLFHGIVEMDECYIGGKPRKSNRREDNKPNKRGRGTEKTPVVGIVERHGRAIAKAFTRTKLNAENLKQFFMTVVDADGSILMTDEYKPYRKLAEVVQHHAVNHKVSYVAGDTHTNTVEGFWALLKRAWFGQHHFWSDKYADLYIAEVSFKYNNRRNGDAFGSLVRHMAGVAA